MLMLTLPRPTPTTPRVLTLKVNATQNFPTCRQQKFHLNFWHYFISYIRIFFFILPAAVLQLPSPAHLPSLPLRATVLSNATMHIATFYYCISKSFLRFYFAFLHCFLLLIQLAARRMPPIPSRPSFQGTAAQSWWPGFGYSETLYP